MTGEPGADVPKAREDRWDGVPAPTWHWAGALGMWVVATIVGTVVIGLLLEGRPSPATLALANVVFGVIVVAVLAVWLSLAHPGWPVAMGLPRHPGLDAWMGLTGGVVTYLVVVTGGGLLVGYLLGLVTGAPVPRPVQVPPDLKGAGLVLTGIYAIVVAPAGEEFFARGILFRSLRARFGFGVAALGSSVFFGAIHAAVPGSWQSKLLLVLVMIGFGFAMAIAYERRATILTPVVAHAVSNAIAFAIILRQR